MTEPLKEGGSRQRHEKGTLAVGTASSLRLTMYRPSSHFLVLSPPRPTVPPIIITLLFFIFTASFFIF